MMKELEFKGKSWHRRLAFDYAGYDEYRAPNICTYGRHVLYGALIAFFFAVIGAAVLAPIVLTTLNVIVWFQTGHFDFTSQAFVAFLFELALILFIALMVWHEDYKKKVRMKKMEAGEWDDATTATVKPKSFLSVWYESFREKTCIRIKFTEE